MFDGRQPVARKIFIARAREGTRTPFTISHAYDRLMPAAEASSDVRGGVTIACCSHIPNIHSSPNVRTLRADTRSRRPYNANMARRGIPKSTAIWYLREWMAVAGMEGRGAQTRMMELTGWSKATMSQLYNGTQDYNPKILEEASTALSAEPYELLMHPERAMAVRKLRSTAAEIVKSEVAAPPVAGARTGTGG